METLKRLVELSHGIVLVTGPTGSGKTTTLYAALSRINTAELNIITIEEPIEYQLRGISQIEVANKKGLTFATGLRSIVRQDPDVIMVGEVRDLETAEIAIQSALTGHLVFSTLHTNDAPGAVTRLVDLGVEPFLVASAVVAVVAQRLVRVLCETCKETYVPEPKPLRDIGIDPAGVKVLWRGRGCADCLNSGYKGRTAIYEFLVVDDRVRDQVMRRDSSTRIKQEAVQQGMKTLRMDGADKILRGITTVEEVARMTQRDNL
jgi:type II secretory ATPase GspE/PulE/Tfp pilus assembly ATPase PilB-like protein